MSGPVPEDEKVWLHTERGKGMNLWQKEPPGGQTWR